MGEITSPFATVLRSYIEDHHLLIRYSSEGGSEDAQEFDDLEYDECEEWKEWVDTETKTTMWTMISNSDDNGFYKFLTENPCAVHARSADGRGPLFWAYEFDRAYIVDTLKSMGADPEATD